MCGRQRAVTTKDDEDWQSGVVNMFTVIFPYVLIFLGACAACQCVTFAIKKICSKYCCKKPPENDQHIGHRDRPSPSTNAEPPENDINGSTSMKRGEQELSELSSGSWPDSRFECEHLNNPTHIGSTSLEEGIRHDVEDSQAGSVCGDQLSELRTLRSSVSSAPTSSSSVYSYFSNSVKSMRNYTMWSRPIEEKESEDSSSDSVVSYNVAENQQ